MKEYTFRVDVTWIQAGIEGKNIKEAKHKLKEIFYEEFKFRPKEKEIKEIK